jgi:hypothetical protein
MLFEIASPPVNTTDPIDVETASVVSPKKETPEEITIEYGFVIVAFVEATGDPATNKVAQDV